MQSAGQRALAQPCPGAFPLVVINKHLPCFAFAAHVLDR